MKIIGQLIIKLLGMSKKIKYSYIIEDIEAMRQYLYRRFKGKIALEILDGFSNIGQQGAFIGRTIQLLRNAEKGTVYHEEFHVIFDHVFGKAKQNKLIDALLNSPEFAGYLEEVGALYGITDKKRQAREALAELYRDFMLGKVSNELTNNSLWKTIVEFFKDLLALMGLANMVYNTGDYKRILLKEFNKVKNTESFNLDNSSESTPQYRIGTLNSYRVLDALKGMHFFMVDYLRAHPLGLQALLINSPQNAAAIQEALGHTKQQIIDALNLKLNTIKRAKAAIPEATATNDKPRLDFIYSSIARFEQEVNLLNELLQNWAISATGVSAIQAYTSYLSDIGIDISKNVDYNVVEDLNENEVKHNAQYIDKGTIDYKKLLDKELKLLLSGIPKMSNEGSILFNGMGLPSTYDYNTLYDKLLGKLRNITSDTSLQDIVKAIERIAISNPEFKQLIEPIQLKGTQDRLFKDRKAPEPRLPLLKAIEAHKNPNAKQLTLLEANFLAKFIQTFSKSYNIGIYTIVNSDGKVAVVDPIKSSIRSTLTNSWTTAALQHMEEAKKKNRQPFYTLNEKGERVYLDKPGLAAHIKKRIEDEVVLKEAPSIVPSVRSTYLLLKELDMPVPIYMLENVFINNPNAFSEIGARLQIIINSFSKNGTPSLEFFREHILLRALVNHSAPITHSSRINLNGDRVFNYGQHSFVTNTFNKLRQAPTGNREDLINYLDQKLPHLVAIAERGSSVILKELERVDLNIHYGDHEGMRGADGNTTKTYNRLSDSDRIAAKYELERLGNYEFLRPSDSTQNKIISIDRHFAEDVSLKQFIDEVFNDIFIPYIKDDLATIGELGNKFKNATKNSSSFNRLLFSMLYSEDMFEYEGNPQSIAEKKEAAKTKKIVRYSTPDGVMGREQFVESFLEHHKERLLNNFYLYIKNEEEKRLQELLKHNLVTKEDDGTYTAHIRVADRRNHKPMLPPSATNINTEHLDTGTVTKKELMDGIRFFMVNKWIMDTEQIKLIYGDIKHYKDLATAIKRFKAAFGTKAITVTSTWMNDLVNKLHKKIGNQEHLYDDHGRPLIRTAIVNDVVTVSDYAYEHAQVLDKDNPVFIKLQEKYRDLVNEELVEEDKDSITELDIKQLKSEYPALYINLIQELRKNKSQLRSQPYLEMDETDGFSVISLDEYKTLRLRTGEWDNESEKLYQWERQIYEKVPVSTRVFVDPYTGESVPLKEKDLGIHTFPSLKPHYAGPLALGVGEGFVPSIYKTSAMVLLPSVAEAFPRLGKIHDTLIENNIGLLSFYSANKGADTLTQDGKINDLYDSEGAVVTELPLTQDIYYEYMGIQLETGNKLKQKTIVATQPTKQILNGKFEYGRVSSKFKSPDSVQAIVDKFLEANAKRLFLGKKMALHRLGLASKNDRIVVDNVDKFAKHVIKAAEGRAENVKNSIRILIDNLKKGNDVDLEKYAGYKQVESIILSTLNNNMIKQKRQGMAAYQVPSTLFEKNNRVLYDKGTYKSNDLEVSRNENGQITSMEVYLPAYMEELVDGKNDITELLDIVGFRVPTQYVSSIELIKIKGFLPKQAGNIVVMPTEIVGKAGSDFDIDKLYMYMKNTYKKDGKLAVHNEDNWEQEFNSNLQNVVEQIIKDEAPELLEGTMAKYTKSLYDGIATVEDFITHLETSLKSLAKHELTAEPRYIIETLLNLTDSFESAKDAFHLAAIENTWLEAQLELLRLPEASEDLLNPIQTKDLRAIADEVNKIKENPYGYDMDIPTTFIYNESYLNNLNRLLIKGSHDIGLAALVSTFHVLAQLNNLKIKGDINLPVNMDKKGHILLGGLTTVEGNYNIGDILKQVLSGGVDVVKEPWAVDLGITTATLSLFTTMVMMGVSPKTASFFLHHPLIQEYFHMKTSSQGLVKKELVDNIYKGDSDILNYLLNYLEAKAGAPDELLLNENILRDELTRKDGTTQYAAAVVQALGSLLNFSSIITDTILKTNPDTDGGGSSLGQVIINVTKGISLLGNENHPIKNIRNLYSKNGFLNPYYSNTYDIFRIIKELSVVKAESGFFKITGPLLSLVHQLFTGSNINAQRVSSIANRMITDTATKLLVTNPITLPKTGDEITLSEFRKYFMRGDNSFAKFWATLADTPLGKTRLIFQKIKPILNDDTGYHFLKNESGELLKNEIDAITTDWADLSTILYEAPNGLKIDAGTMLLLQFLTQSGLTLTVNSALQYAPADLYNSIVGPAFEAAKFAEQDTSFISKLRFIINNVHDTILMGYGYGRTSGFAFHKNFKPQYAKLTNIERAALRSKGTILHTATGYLSVQLGNLTTITDENGEGIQVPHNSVIEGRALTTFGTEVERKILQELATNNRFVSNKDIAKFGYMISQDIENTFENTLNEITAKPQLVNEIAINALQE